MAVDTLNKGAARFEALPEQTLKRTSKGIGECLSFHPHLWFGAPERITKHFTERPGEKRN